MDKDTALAALRSWFTAWAICLGSCRCIADCFRLEIPRHLALSCCLLALGSTGIMLLRRGGRLLLPPVALALGYFSRNRLVRGQFLGLFQQILSVFHSAYGWKVPDFAPASRECAIPLLFWALLQALAVCHGVCRRKRYWPGILLAGSSLALCAMAPDPEPSVWALFLLLEGLGVLLFTAQVRQQHLRQANRLGFSAALVLGIFLLGLLLLNPKESYVNRSGLLRQQLSVAAGWVPGEVGNALALLLQASQSPRQIPLSSLGPRQPEEAAVLTVTAQSSGPLYLRRQHYDCYDGKNWTVSMRRTEILTPVGPGEPVTIQTRQPEAQLLLPQPCGEALTVTGGTAENRTRLTAYTLLRGENTAETPPSDLSRLPEETLKGIEVLFPEGLSPEAVGMLLSQGHYTLSPAEFPPEEADFALWFLNTGMEGYCVHFAATAAVLLRSSGIPARLVTGYLVETEPGVPVTVTEGHAHAWAEYYDSQHSSWRILEATPSREAATETAPQEAEKPEFPEATAPALPWVVAAILPAVLLAGMLLRILRRRKLCRGSPNRQALRRWQEALRLSRLLGETPPPELHALAQKARFSPHILTEAELEEFNAYLRYCANQLEKNSFLKRLVLGPFHGVY